MIVKVVRNVLDWSKAETIVSKPGMIDALCPPELRDISTVEAFVDKRPVPREEWDECLVDDSQELMFVLRPAGPAAPGLILFFQVASLVGLAVMFKRSQQATKRGDESSPSYSWTGIGNSRVEGLPIQMICGRFRVGGQVVNEYTQALGIPSTSDLYVLLSFGHGPVEAIGNILVDTDDLTGASPTTLLIEDNPAENYDDITTWVRMGSSEQETIPNFHRLYSTVGTAFRMRGEKSNQISNHGLLYVTGDPMTTDYDADWDTYGVTVDHTEAVDGALATVAFERGLFRARDDGSVDPSFFQLQFRYRELDGSNLPITTGGPNGDGWVRENPELMISPDQSDSFERAYAVGPFVDPQTWVIGALGNALNATAASPEALAPISSGNPKLGITTDAWTVAFWFRLNTALPDPSGAPSDQVYMIVGNTDTADNTGFRVAFQNVNGVGWYLQFRVDGPSGGGGGSGDVRCQTIHPLSTEVDVWHHVTATYKRKAETPTKDRCRLWVDKKIVAERKDGTGSNKINFQIAAVVAPESVRMLHDINDATFIDGCLDDVVFMEAQAKQAFVDDRVDNPVPLDDPNVIPNLRARWKFDETPPTATATQDIFVSGVKWFDNATLTDCDTNKTGVVQASATGTRKRMKVRLEALRLNFDMKRKDVFDDGDLTSVAPYIDEALSYPTTPLLGMRVRATDQLNTTQPRATVEVKGLRFPQWNGTGAIPTLFAWTQNPSWIVLGMLTNTDYGLGNRFSFDNMDMDSFLAWANYCDEAVYDGSYSDGADEGIGWDDIRYDAGTTGPDPDNPAVTITRGSLAFIYSDNSDTPADHFQVGKFVRPTGVPTVGGGADVNVDDVTVRGYEIKSIGFNATTASYEVVGYWDRLTETDPWTDGTNLQSHTTVAGSTTSGHNRFHFDAVFDEERDAWEAILDVCSVGRAIPIKEGANIRISYQHPLPTGTFADHILSRGKFEDGTFKIDYTGPQDKPLVYDIEFLNEEETYDRQIWKALSPVLTNAQQSSAEDMRTESISLFGVTHRAQAERHGNFLHNVNRLVLRTGEFRVGPSGIRVEPGDVAIVAHDVLPRGVSGRASGTGTTSQVIVSEPFEILAATTYYVYVQSHLNDQIERGTLDTGVTVPGDYPTGGTLTLTSALINLPTDRLTPYVLVADGSELRVRITETSLDEDLTVLVRWSEYQDALYDDDATQVETSSDFFGPLGGGPVNTTGQGDVGAGRARDHTLLDGPARIEAIETLVSDAGAGRGHRLRMSWSWTPEEEARVQSVRVHMRRGPVTLVHEEVATAPDGAWTLAGEYDGERHGAVVPIPWPVTSGDEVQVAVQGVTVAGTRRRPSRCQHILYTVVGASIGPPTITTPSAEMDGARARYRWTPPGRTGLEVEIRRGGWILGQTVAVVPADDGQTDLLANWSGSVSGDQFPLLFATRDDAGQYGDRVSLDFTPAPETASIQFPTDYDSQAWESYADGWVTDSVAPIGDPLLSNLQRHADGYLEFSGSNISGTYSTWDPSIGAVTIRRALVPYRAFLEASVEAEQVHPITWSEMDWFWGDTRYDRWTWEGPAWVPDGETANAVVDILWRYTKDGTTWSGWVDFRPGLYDLVDFQFRLSARRPNSDYQIKIHRFHTRAQMVRQSAIERDRVSAALEREIF